MKETTRHRLELEYSVGSGKEEKRIQDLCSKLDHVLRGTGDGNEYSMWQKYGQEILLICFVNNADERWQEVRKLLDAEGLLEHATVWKDADDIEYRIQLYPVEGEVR